MKTEWITSPDGAHIAYDVSGHGSALMLLHGAGKTRQDWHKLGYVERLRMISRLSRWISVARARAIIWWKLKIMRSRKSARIYMRLQMPAMWISSPSGDLAFGWQYCPKLPGVPGLIALPPLR